MDQRFQAYNERVAAIDLKSDIDHHNFVHPECCQIAVPVCDLLDQPNGDRQRQLLCGAPVDVFEDVAGWAFVRHHSDGYVVMCNLRHWAAIPPQRIMSQTFLPIAIVTRISKALT